MDATIAYLLGIGSIIVSNAPFLVGFILPPLVEALNKDIPNQRERRYISILICFIVAIVLHWNEIELGTPQMAVAYFILLYGEQQTLFRVYFSDSRLRSYIQEKVNTSWTNGESSSVVSS